MVKIFHDLKSLATDLSNIKKNDNNEQTSSEQTNVLVSASRSKAEAKSFYLLIHTNCTHWIKNLAWYWVWRWFVHRLPSVKTMEDSSSWWSLTSRRRWSIQFWRFKSKTSKRFRAILRLVRCKSTTINDGGNKKMFQYCPDSFGAILYLRVVQGHSECNLADPTLQDNVLIPNDLVKNI